MENIIIQGNNTGYLKMGDFIFTDSYATANAEVHSDWYTARVEFEISKERLQQHLEELKMIDDQQRTDSLLINEYGNFEIGMNMDFQTGNCKIKGVMMKSMNEDANLIFELTCDWHNFRLYISSLESTLNG